MCDFVDLMTQAMSLICLEGLLLVFKNKQTNKKAKNKSIQTLKPSLEFYEVLKLRSAVCSYTKSMSDLELMLP